MRELSQIRDAVVSALAAEAVAAETPQPQVADSLPVKILIYTFRVWEKASAFSSISLEAPR